MVCGGKIYVDCDMSIRNTTVIADTAVEIQRRPQPDWFGVETNQFQQLLAVDIRGHCEECKVLIPLYTMQNQVNKLVRIRRLTPYLSNKQLRFKGGSPGARRLVEQMRDFPNGDHDDGPDALEMAIRLINELLARYESDQYETVLLV
jgi:predicted phage terminase large subunit-like protein